MKKNKYGIPYPVDLLFSLTMKAGLQENKQNITPEHYHSPLTYPVVGHDFCSFYSAVTIMYLFHF